MIKGRILKHRISLAVVFQAIGKSDFPKKQFPVILSIDIALEIYFLPMHHFYVIKK